MAEFTLPLPVAVISRLMGINGSAWDRMRHWSEHAFSDGTHEGEQVASVLKEFGAFGADLLTERRRTPGEDLISSLVAAADEEGGVPEAQLVSLVCGLVVGGHDSTMTMLGNALLYLLGERRETWPRLGADEEAAGRLVDRLIHLVPLGDDRGSTRHAAEDVEIGGVTIPAGAIVLADCGMANRDPEVFPPATLHDLFAPLEAPTLSFGATTTASAPGWPARSCNSPCTAWQPASRTCAWPPPWTRSPGGPGRPPAARGGSASDGRAAPPRAATDPPISGPRIGGVPGPP